MKVSVKTLDNKAVGDVTLADAVLPSDFNESMTISLPSRALAESADFKPSARTFFCRL